MTTMKVILTHFSHLLQPHLRSFSSRDPHLPTAHIIDEAYMVDHEEVKEAEKKVLFPPPHSSNFPSRAFSVLPTFHLFDGRIYH